MRAEVVRWLQCPVCAGALAIRQEQGHGQTRQAAAAQLETGSLMCEGCRRQFPIREGVPQLLSDVERVKRRSSGVYGLLWSKTPTQEPAAGASAGYHFDRVRAVVDVPKPDGLWLDAGCGDGTDLVALARATSGPLIGVDISEGGTQTAYQRTKHLPHVHVVRADLEHLPLRTEGAQFVYSYGVLHHLPHPAQGLRELTRVLAPEGMLVTYVYEDFQERTRVERMALWSINRLRAVTTLLPPRLLYGVCWGAAPLVALTCSWPAHLLRRHPATRALADRIPYRHTTQLRTLANDLYDRFGAPVEYRYSRAALETWLEEAGLLEIAIHPFRGWLASARKSSTVTAPC